MSYILDALKKSDQERKQGDVPNLQTVHMSVTPEQTKPLVLYGVVLFLLMALAFAVGVLLSSAPETGVDVVQKEVRVDSPLSNKSSSPSQVSKSQINVTHESANMPISKDVAKSLVQQTKQVVDVVEAHEEKSAQVARNQNDIPFLYELADYEQQLVPEMNFAGHVYSSDEASRSVIINGRAMSEGDTLMRGLSVEQITSSGVVFRFNSIMFRVDVLQDWSFE